MSEHPDYSRTVSLQLSEVLNDIGVHEKMVKKRSRMNMLRETMHTSTWNLLDKNISFYHFGSQTEGSTTIGLKSDTDSLICFNLYNLIQDKIKWKPGMKNILMIQDEKTSPGYCLLQELKNDEPNLPIFAQEFVHIEQSRGKILLKNTILKDPEQGEVIIGPATSRQRQFGIPDQDCVQAYHCKSWPVDARPWLLREGIGKWPTEEMKRNCETTGCFVVPVGSKTGQNEELEWRISTSQAERCLMLSLNITQMRCYILMKMILKAFIKPQCEGVLSSFMCKTALFHCIQNTHSSNWQQHNLLECLKCCLTELQDFVRQENCPHFIIPENNLMAGRMSPHNKHTILAILQNVIQSEGRELLKIPIDDLGKRLQNKMNKAGAFHYTDLQSSGEMFAKISTQLLFNVALTVSDLNKKILNKIFDSNEIIVCDRLSNFISTLTRTCTETDSDSLEKSALKILAPPLSSSLGSVIASHDIYTTGSISPEAMARFSSGLDSDVASSRLKLASALYCVGDMERAESVLRDTEGKYDLYTVEPACKCYINAMTCIKTGLMNKCNTGNEELIQHFTAFCVRFLRCEINCVPKELQYEMYRSTQEDMLQRYEEEDNWMDWAVIDSLPYLYFLQYKTYRALQRVTDRQLALANLIRTIEIEQNLGHKETALNLLGQCMEQENHHSAALHCYRLSLNIRARNNAARVHICRLLNELVNMQENVLD